MLVALTALPSKTWQNAFINDDDGGDDDDMVYKDHN